MKCISLSIILSLLAFGSVFSSKYYAPGRSEMSDDVLEIPLIYCDGLYYIEIEVKGRYGWFLLDFGAQGLVLDRNSFEGIDFEEAKFSSAIQGEIKGGRTSINHAKLTGLDIYNQRAFIIDLSHLQKESNAILGLAGISIFSHFEIKINLHKRKLVLYKLNSKGSPISQSSFLCHDNCSIVPIQFKNGIVVIQGSLSSFKSKFVLDSGAEFNVINSRYRKLNEEGFRAIGYAKIRASGGRRKLVATGLLIDLSIGEVELGFMQAVSADLLHIKRAYGVGADGLLGIEFLERAELTINFYHELLGIQPS